MSRTLLVWIVRQRSSKVPTADITIGDETIGVETTLRSEYNFITLRGEYSYSIFQDDRMDLAAGIGLYVMPIEFKLGTRDKKAVDEDITAPFHAFPVWRFCNHTEAVSQDRARYPVFGNW